MHTFEQRLESVEHCVRAILFQIKPKIDHIATENIVVTWFKIKQPKFDNKTPYQIIETEEGFLALMDYLEEIYSKAVMDDAPELDLDSVGG